MKSPADTNGFSRRDVLSCILCIIFALVAVACSGIGPKPQIKGQEDWEADADFVDNTAKYKGKSLTMPLTYLGSDISTAKLRDRLGTNGLFRGEAAGGGFNIIIDLPATLDVPDVQYLGHVVVTFDCKEGNLDKGNLAKKIERAK
jgi:hypothetical protein